MILCWPFARDLIELTGDLGLCVYLPPRADAATVCEILH